MTDNIIIASVTLPHSTTLTYAVGVAGVTRIFRDGYSPEPYCSVSQLKIIQNNTEIIYNQAYIAKLELVTEITNG
jgi:hypothetical protein